jgi:hypothetical protein
MIRSSFFSFLRPHLPSPYLTPTSIYPSLLIPPMNDPQSGLVKKPTNLMGGQATFIEKAAPEKPTTKSVIVVSER